MRELAFAAKLKLLRVKDWIKLRVPFNSLIRYFRKFTRSLTVAWLPLRSSKTSCITSEKIIVSLVKIMSMKSMSAIGSTSVWCNTSTACG